jgi:predicted NACHT family NTPase
MSSELDPNKLVAEVTSTLITDLFVSMYDSGKEAIKIPIERVRLHSIYTTYIATIYKRYAKAKSFLIRNRPVPLYDFYVPVGIQSGRTFYPAASISNITAANNFAVITGLAGSGKTLLMRHLLLDALFQKESIPVLVELRNVAIETKSLKEIIIEVLSENKYVVDEKFITQGFEKGRFTIILDGLDEVSFDVRTKLIKGILGFAKNYANCSIIVSSRPENIFYGWEDFTIWKITHLTLEQACQLVTKSRVPFSTDLIREFVKDLKEKLFAEHESFLSNPLLLSIMLLTYEERREIPPKLSIFYQQAYEVLFQKHDALKPEFSRPRHTNLDIRDFGKVFAAFSIQTYDNRQQVEFSETEALAYVQRCKAERIVNVDFNSGAFLKDAKDHVCLLIDDGTAIKFTHRSFQEYFTAQYIADKEERTSQVKLLKRYAERFERDSAKSR